MPKIEANGINLHYISAGEGPDVVLLHGFLGNLAVWHLYMMPVLRREFKVLTYDLRGHGYSQVTPTGYTAKNMAEDLLGLLDALKINKCTLMGHSYGADICLYFALKHPDRVDKILALEPGLDPLSLDRAAKIPTGSAGKHGSTSSKSAASAFLKTKKLTLAICCSSAWKRRSFTAPRADYPRNREPLLKLLRETTL